jgi:hypothetical protein
MRPFRKLCATFVLTLVLALSALAGDISFPGATTPPPPPPQESSVTGEIGFPGVTATGDMVSPDAVALDPVTEAALSLLQSILSLF